MPMKRRLTFCWMPKDAYGQTFMALFQEEVIRQGGRVVGVASYDTQQTYFGAVIRKLPSNSESPLRPGGDEPG